MKTIIAFLCLFLFAGTELLSASEVPINPITPDIRKKLKESTELISRVEDNLAPSVSELEKIYRTYNETCKGGDGDRGCVELQNQLRQRYREVLSNMNDNLPKVRETVFSTANDLGRSIKSRTQRKDIKELYEDVSRKRAMPQVRGPLSAKLSELLTVMGTDSSSVSILELSLRTQADLISATEFLEFLEARISHQMIMVDMIQDFGVLSPEMATVMRGVSELFGYNLEFDAPVLMEQQTAGDDWRK